MPIYLKTQKNPHGRSSHKEMKDCEDFHYATFIGTGDIHASRIAVAILITSKFIVSVDLCGAFGVLQYTFLCLSNLARSEVSGMY